VAGLCMPAYVWLETNTGAEYVRPLFGCAAVLAILTVFDSIGRAIRSAVKSHRYVRLCRSFGAPAGGMLVIESAAPVVALAGVVRSVLIVSRCVLDALSPDQLAAAVLHERAHHARRDNLRRLAFLLAPELFPFVRCFRTLEREWTRLAEWAADDCATAGSRERSLSLASALVRVARLDTGAQPPAPLAISLLGDAQDLAPRVERLLDPRDCHGQPWLFAIAAVTLATAAVFAARYGRPLLVAVHEVIEWLI